MDSICGTSISIYFPLQTLSGFCLHNRALLAATPSPVVFCHNDVQEGKRPLPKPLLSSLYKLIVQTLWLCWPIAMECDHYISQKPAGLHLLIDKSPSNISWYFSPKTLALFIHSHIWVFIRISSDTAATNSVINVKRTWGYLLSTYNNAGRLKLLN